jgi:DNA-binding transcriptional regulator YhcF (GntR family)
MGQAPLRFVPRYYEIEQALRARIADLKPDSPLPSDAMLCEEFGVSRMTARNAVQRLVQEGIVYRVPGRGTFVAEPPVHRQAGNLLSFTEEMRRRGLDPRSEVVEHVLRPAGGDEARRLELEQVLRDQPLERVAVEGLGHRAQATVQVFPAGLSLALTGRDAAWIPAASLDEAARASYAIDRGVEPDGLARIGWRLGGTPVDTYLRPRATADGTTLLDAVRALLSGQVASTPDPTEREN